MPTKKLYLPVKYRKQIESLFQRYLPDVDVWAYGSRINGKSHPASDLDLVLRAPHLNNIDGIKLINLKSALTDSNIPFLVEVRDWSLLPKSFHEEIKKNYIVLLKGDNKKATIPAEPLKAKSLAFSPAQPVIPAQPLKAKSLAFSPAQPTSPTSPVIPANAGIQNTSSSKPPQPLGLKQKAIKEKKASNKLAQPVIPANAGIQKIPSSKPPQPLGLKQEAIKEEKINNPTTNNIKKSQFKLRDTLNHWKLYPFQECITKISSNRINQIPKSEYLRIGSFPVIDQGKQFISGWTNNKEILFKDNLPVIIFGDHTRIFKYITKPFAIGADGTKIIKPNDNFNIQFFYYFMLHLNIPSKGYNRHYKLLKDCKILCPPMMEQKKIARVLSRIQKAVEVQDKLIERTEELKQATMKQLFTYGLTHEAKTYNSALLATPLKAKSLAFSPANAGIQNTPSFKPLQPFGLKPEAIKEKKASNQPTTPQGKSEKPTIPISSAMSAKPLKAKSLAFSPAQPTGPTSPVIPAKAGIQKIPAHWNIKEIEDLFELKQGKSLSAKNQTGLYKKPFLRTSNVFWGYLNMKKVDEMDILKREREPLMLKKGDLLVCEGGDIGRTAIWNEELKECYYQNHIHRLRAKGKNVFPVFYMYWMDVAVRQLNIYGTFGNRTTIPNLPGKRLLKFKIPLPPLEEQKKIAMVLQKIDQKAENHKKKKKTLEELFKTMLQKLMTGQIPVNDIKL